MAPSSHRKSLSLEGPGSSHTQATLRSSSTHSRRSSEDAAITEALMARAYHLPGNNNWLNDWWQYMTNNHPVAGICLHHRLHPVSSWLRVAVLLGSVLFGLAVASAIYLAFELTASDSQYVELKTNATRTGLNPDLDDNISVLSVTNANLVLWTAGAFVNGLYDNVLWQLAGSAICSKRHNNAQDSHNQKWYKKPGVFLVLSSVVVVFGLATLMVVLRVAVDVHNNSDDEASLVINGNATTHKKDGILYWEVPVNDPAPYTFILAYLVELGLNYVVYYPLIGTVMFSGVLTCGHWPVVGGRPYELRHPEMFGLEDPEDPPSRPSQKSMVENQAQNSARRQSLQSMNVSKKSSRSKQGRKATMDVIADTC